MIIKGFIKEVGLPREWSNKDGEKRQSVKLTLAVPYMNKEGQERQDELMGEMNIQSGEFLESLRKTQASQEKCEFQVGFSLSDWNGKKIQNIKVYTRRPPARSRACCMFSVVSSPNTTGMLLVAFSLAIPAVTP